MYKLFMAFRYLRAHKIIYFSIVGVAVGTLAMIVVTSLMGGFSRDMRSRIRGMQAHIVITSFDKNLWIKDYDQVIAAIRKVPHVTGCAPRLEYEAWLGRNGSYSDVHIVGIVPEQEKTVSELAEFFRKGGKEKFTFEHDDGAPLRHAGVVTGAEMRNGGLLSVVGLLTARQATTPVLCVKDFEVVGRFRSGMTEYDSNYLFTDLASAQEFLQVSDPPPRANVIAIAVDDYDRYGGAVQSAVIEALHAHVPCNNPDSHAPGVFGYRCGKFRTATWEQTRQLLLQAVDVEKGMMYLLLSLVILVAGFNIAAIYTLVVRAKTRDIGILRALGGTEGGVTSIFLISGGLCGLIGSIFGIILGLLTALNLNEILDFVRVVSRELNRIGLDRDHGMNGMPRGATLAALVSLAVAEAGLIWTWLVLYRERRPHPWVRMIATGIALGLAAWFSTAWMPDYRPFDNYDADFNAASRWTFLVIIVATWAAFCAGWRLLDRYRRRPNWVFFGFASSIFMCASFLGLLATGLIAVFILARGPDFAWPGLELFPRKIYYLDRVPVYVDYGAIVYIVLWTLLVSFICSIYPALRAAAANPVEAIRDE
jgi:lipoprotein-releasing system permease protein